MRKLKKKSVVVSIIIILLIITGVVLFLVFGNKKEEKVEVTAMEQLAPLEKDNSSEAAELIKKNIVKIVNTIDEETKIIGTGFFDKSGYLVTNSHIVDIKGDISIEYYDGTKEKAVLFSNDITSDIALLAVENPKVKAMYFGKTLDIKVTDDVFAVGYPFALEGEASVSKGVLSARRSAGGIEFLQSDIALNQGNSGGPLINGKGELLGINTYATENASIGMSISSESLEIIINKLIESKEVKYLEEERPSNALSIVLVEIGHKTDDMYNEKGYLKKNEEEIPVEDEEKYDEENNAEQLNQGKSSGNNDNNSRPSEPKKDYSIETHRTIATSQEYKSSSNIMNTFFELGSDLTGCELDDSDVNPDIGGKYSLTVNCNENSKTIEIRIDGPRPPSHIDIPEIVMDETKNNVTSFDELSGTTWYFPGYSDVCQKFYYDGLFYVWESHRFDWVSGTPHLGTGGGNGYRSFEELLSNSKFWLEGDFLVVTVGQKSYTLTKIKGEGLYFNEYSC